MPRPFYFVSVLALVAMRAIAQQAPPDPAAVIDSLEKQMAPLSLAWLNSADARLQAWGAYMALRDRRTEAIPLLQAKLAKFEAVEELATQADEERHDAMIAILDALIQLDAPVPSADAQRIYTEFPVQSLILLSRAPDDPAPALFDTFTSDRRLPAAWLAAGNLLMQRRAEGFAKTVVEGLTVHALITVTEPGTGGGFGGSASCCGGILAKLKVGWPAVGVYSFAGCGANLQPGAMILAPGTDPSYYNRQVNGSYRVASGCGCNPDRDLVRQHYLTTLLAASADDPPVRAHVSHNIPWQGAESYAAELAAFIAGQQQTFARLATRLGEQSLVGAEDARTLQPALEIHVWDQRASRQPSLPSIADLPRNVVVDPFQ